MPEPRRLGDVLSGTVQGISSSDQAQAYSAWLRAVGPEVAAATRPGRFARGTLTVGCESSVWANELAYLTGTILERMGSIDPAHPVKRLRFEAVGPFDRQGNEAPAANPKGGRRKLADTELDEALARTADLSDEGLRAAVRAALGAALKGPHEDGP
jgi:hypothetical protein